MSATSDHAARAKTINAKGEIVPKPYGPGRWASPKRYGCKHDGCTNAASVLKSDHGIEPGAAAKAHNCCGRH